MSANNAPSRKIGKHPALAAPYTPPDNIMLLGGADPYSVAATRVWYDAEAGELRREPISWKEFWTGASTT